MKNYYKILKLAQDASSNEINEAYRMLSQKYNPNIQEKDRYVEERFIDITLAYKTLIDNDKRKDYDRILRSLAMSSDVISDMHVKENGTVYVGEREKVSLLHIVPFILIAIAALLFVQIGKLIVNSREKQSAKVETIVPIKSEPIVIQPAPVPAKVAEKKVDKVVVDKNSIAAASEKKKLMPVEKVAAVAVKKDTVITNTRMKYSVGDSKKEVLRIQGTPNAITRYDEKSEIWHYGNSSVFFMNGVLKSYNNGDNTLLVQPK